MHTMTRIVITILLLGSVATSIWAQQATSTDQLTIGRAVYQRECQMCHGDKGDGLGPAAHLLTPKPRNFTTGVFKLRSTPNGELPTDHDLFRTITMGIPNSMMPSFRELPENERWALVEVVKAFAGIRQAPSAVRVPPEPTVTKTVLARGEQMFQTLKCGDCHGASGQGDGPSALTLETEDGARIWATDLTRGMFKGGQTGTDLYLRIATGMDGTPMPAFADAATPEDLWALVHYVQSLRHPGSKTP